LPVGQCRQTLRSGNQRRSSNTKEHMAQQQLLWCFVPVDIRAGYLPLGRRYKRHTAGVQRPRPSSLVTRERQAHQQGQHDPLLPPGRRLPVNEWGIVNGLGSDGSHLPIDLRTGIAGRTRQVHPQPIQDALGANRPNGSTQVKPPCQIPPQFKGTAREEDAVWMIAGGYYERLKAAQKRSRAPCQDGMDSQGRMEETRR